jgi:hypothetical protein
MGTQIEENVSIIYVDVSLGAGKIVFLPPAASCIGKLLRVHDLTGDCNMSNVILVEPSSGDTIDNSTSPVPLSNAFATLGVIGQSATNFSVIQISTG